MSSPPLLRQHPPPFPSEDSAKTEDATADPAAADRKPRNRKTEELREAVHFPDEDATTIPTTTNTTSTATPIMIIDMKVIVEKIP